MKSLREPTRMAPLDQLATEVARIIRREIGRDEVKQIWSEPDRILFRLADGRTGDVEVVVNWDIECPSTGGE
jgi:hypothetical protein